MTGDKSDMLARIKALLPPWFADSNPVLDALLSGPAVVLAWIYTLYSYAKLQTRILTATDGWLDLIAQDFFGNAIQRKANQSDTSFRNWILINLFRERATRNAIIKVLTQITGRTPIVYEPLRLADNGAYGAPFTGYGVAGAYGSMLLPFQTFVTAYRPSSAGIPLVAGYGVPTGGYSQPSRAEYANLASSLSVASDNDIYAAIDSTKPAGTIAWVKILN